MHVCVGGGTHAMEIMWRWEDILMREFSFFQGEDSGPWVCMTRSFALEPSHSSAWLFSLQLVNLVSMVISSHSFSVVL